jgi:hypothetical protein
MIKVTIYKKNKLKIKKSRIFAKITKKLVFVVMAISANFYMTVVTTNLVLKKNKNKKK